jgi:hypothetical protein
MNKKQYEKIEFYKSVLIQATLNGDVDAVYVMEPEFIFITSICDHRYPNGKLAFSYTSDKPICHICMRKVLK